ncbi:uncharacterized protein LOC123550882 [Mercenaria mercenaria]|uniref:uncharacterized protein LOC123550882 n=1 Tax=Mercenaria mercenaria TaxID=6596 RepID=UPI00234E5233|nr:uncharacterized protein LOC123550882 [Mercenaria mercenaria]
MPMSEMVDTQDVSEWDFVGRKLDFRNFDQAWSKHKLFGIFGIRSVGKSRCVREYIKSKQCHVTHVELQYIDCIESLHSNICALLGLEPNPNSTETDQWIKEIISAVAHASKNEGFVVFFDNAENVIESPFKDKFLLLLTKLVKGCRKIKIFVTSTTRIQFSQFRFFTHEVHPLVPSEAKELLQTVAPDVDLGEYGDVIVKLSEGLPLMLLMIGAELKEDDGLLSPADMVELLCKCRLETLSNEFYPEEDRVGDVYRNFILRLSGEFQSHLTELDYIPGSFNVQEAGGLLGIETEAMTKQTAIIPIRRKHMLNYDPENRRFNIQGILREVLNANFAIKDLPELRKKYCKVFTDVMKKISEQMGTDEYTRAFSEFAVEQPNLQKLLGDVEYTREDTYHFFIEIVSSYTPVIETFMSRESDTFYDACLRLTDMYGKTRDKAVVHIAVGSMATNTKGDFLHGANNYQSALTVLENMEKSIQLASVYQKLGWNMHKQGLNDEAIQYYKKSLDISLFGGPEYEYLAMQSFSCMGISHTFLGNFERAEKYHITCLNRRKAQLGECHPNIGATINNIGLLMDQKGDSAKALEYHLQALDIKRKSKAPVTSLIYSLSNVANAYNALGRYDDAHALLDEAMKLIREQKIPMKDTEALIYNTRGKVCSKAGNLDGAHEAFAMSVNLSKEISMKGFLLMKRIVSLAEVQERQGNFAGCMKTIKEAMKLKKESIKSLPHNTITVECLECLAKVYKGTDDRLNYVQTLYDIETECLRLERVCRQQNYLQKLEKVSDTLWDIRQKMEHLSL